MNDNFFMLRRRDWEGIPRAAVNPLRRLRLLTVRGCPSRVNPCDACVAPLGAARKTSLFFTPREIPSQSRLLVIGLVLHE